VANIHQLPAVMQESGVDSYRMSTDAATICRELVLATAQEIQGRKYVRVEGWQAIAIAHHCTASSCNVERVDGGFRATGQVRRMDTGSVIAEAEGFVGEDEATWFGGEAEVWDKQARKKVKKMLPKRPDFAIRAMAQTRAISRACRSAFAHVVVQIDKKLGTTPAEEMQGVYDHDPSSVGGPGSSWGPRGKEGAIDDAEADGLMANAPARKGSDIARDAANLAKSKKKVDDAIGTIKLSGQTVESLDGYMDANRKAFDWIAERFPEEYDRIYAVYVQARADAEARAG
jgi:hypothetical protein